MATRLEQLCRNLGWGELYDQVVGGREWYDGRQQIDLLDLLSARLTETVLSAPNFTAGQRALATLRTALTRARVRRADVWTALEHAETVFAEGAHGEKVSDQLLRVINSRFASAQMQATTNAALSGTLTQRAAAALLIAVTDAIRTEVRDPDVLRRIGERLRQMDVASEKLPTVAEARAALDDLRSDDTAPDTDGAPSALPHDDE